MSPERPSLARIGVQVFFSSWIQLLMSLATGIVLVRMLGSEGKGIVALFSAGAVIAGTLGGFGLPAASVYHLRKGLMGERPLLLVNFLLILAFCALLALLHHLTWPRLQALFFPTVEVRPEWPWLAVATVPVFMANSFLGVLLLGQGEARTYSFLTTGGALLTLILTGAAVGFLGYGISGALGAYLAAQGMVGILVLLRRMAATRTQSWRFKPAELARLLGYGLRQSLVVWGALLLKKADHVMVGSFLGIRELGYYSVATQLFESVLSVPRSIHVALAGDSAGSEAAESANRVARSARILFWLLLAVCLAVALLSPWMVPLLFGADFQRAVVPVAILMGAALTVGIVTTLQPFFLGSGRPGLTGLLTLLMGAGTLALGIFLIPALGLEGASLARVAGGTLSVILHAVLLVRLTGLRYADLVWPQPEDAAAWRGLAARWFRSGKPSPPPRGTETDQDTVAPG